VALIALIYWNHAAWIARANFERYESRNTLDLHYVLESLGRDALPEVVRFLPRLPMSMQENVRSCLRAIYLPQRSQVPQYHWYEWNYRRAQFVDALRFEQAVTPSITAAPGSVSSNACAW
jgi:hypothetical protein